MEGHQTLQGIVVAVLCGTQYLHSPQLQQPLQIGENRIAAQTCAAGIIPR
jgi:hypothetical protein